jgi:hypothetical protein|nr:MAG TPA: hypothetical protein [Caudoviricetes sp.]
MKRDLTLLEQAQQFNNGGFDPNSVKFKEFKTVEISGDGIATIFFRRDFDTIPFDLLEQNDFFENVEIVYPTDDYFQSLIPNIEEMSDDEVEQEVDRLKDEWRDDSLEMYTVLYRITGWGTEDYYLDGDFCNVDVLAEFGFHVLQYKDYTFLNVPGYGYSIMTEHFVRLFTFLGWMKVEE